MVSIPHGGRLVNRVTSKKRAEALIEESKHLPKIEVSLDLAVDIENIAFGAFSPLEGFMVREDYESVLYSMRLSNDLPWTIPIVLDVDQEACSSFKAGDDVALVYNGEPLAVMKVEEVYRYDKKEYAQHVYKTIDVNHPGVNKVMNLKEFFVGGQIDLIGKLSNPFEKYTLRPIETRLLFKERGWKTIAGFQTRNAPHLGHEYAQKTALAFVDGLFINPLIGRKKKGDFKDEVILAAYEALISNYFPKDVVVLSILRTEMRYAGPREAIFHAIVRKNFGCTHFIVGRDHAGVGSYYKPYEAQELFREFPDLGITPLFLKEFFYCGRCGGVVNEKTCPHPDEFRVRFSGTKIRQIIMKGEEPPPCLIRPEVYKVIK
ncbi:MAG: sulfate adenylyltransferase, partial [Candidatus Methanomethylicota archaeon]